MDNGPTRITAFIHPPHERSRARKLIKELAAVREDDADYYEIEHTGAYCLDIMPSSVGDALAVLAKHKDWIDADNVFDQDGLIYKLPE